MRNSMHLQVTLLLRSSGDLGYGCLFLLRNIGLGAAKNTLWAYESNCHWGWEITTRLDPSPDLPTFFGQKCTVWYICTLNISDVNKFQRNFFVSLRKFGQKYMLVRIFLNQWTRMNLKSLNIFILFASYGTSRWSTLLFSLALLACSSWPSSPGIISIGHFPHCAHHDHRGWAQIEKSAELHG